MSNQSAIFLSKTETRAFPFVTAQKRRRRKSPALSGGRGFKWREPGQSLGRKPFKPQTALLRSEPRRGTVSLLARGNAHASLQIVAEWAFAKAGQRETSRLIWDAAFRPGALEQQKR